MLRNSNYCMKNTQIEDYANKMLEQYRAKYPKEDHSTPIPVDCILDCLWNIYVEVDDIQAKYGPGTFGAWYLDNSDRRIVIDQSLDPDLDPTMKGRYNFSLAHEAGHWMIHAPAILGHRETPTLVGENGEPVILCRSSKKDERERQADRFAGYLLMPRELVTQKWYDVYGDDSKGN